MELLEKDEQRCFVEYCKLCNIVCVHIPNGFFMGQMKNRYGYINSLKAQGYKKGFCDLIVFAKNSQHKLFFLEFKREKGGKLSSEQQEWLDWLNSNGYYAKCAHGCKDAINILNEYLQM